MKIFFISLLIKNIEENGPIPIDQIYLSNIILSDGHPRAYVPLNWYQIMFKSA